ncbi:MAG: hypothetical protein R2734_04095 [Nocardioides sp.]
MEQPIAPAVAEWASALTGSSVADLAAAILRRAEDAVQETGCRVASTERIEGDVSAFRRARTVDTVECRAGRGQRRRPRRRRPARGDRRPARPRPGRVDRGVPPGGRGLLAEGFLHV